MAKTTYLSIVAIAVAFLCACSSLPPSPQKPQHSDNNYSFVNAKLNWLIASEMKKHRISGLSIALVNGQDILWQQGFGIADKDNNIAVTGSTRFRAGSLIKPLNAIALLRLQNSNKVALDAPVQSYLPEFSPPSRFQDRSPITIEQCLTHLSGLPSNLIKGMWTDEPQNFKTSLEYLNKAHVAQPPNTVFRYSNLAHNVLGAIIEKQSAEPYQQHMDKLFGELGMQQSEVLGTPKGLAKAYHKGKQLKVYGLRDVPAAGLVSSAEDLAKLLVFFNGIPGTDSASERIARASSSEILTPQNWLDMRRDYSGSLALNLGKRHGLGLIYYDGLFHRSLKVYGHGGASVNHRALIKFIPQEKLGVALLSNAKNSSSSLHKIANEALSLLLEAKLGRPAPHNSPRWPQAGSDDIVDPEKMLGHYATAGGMAKVYKKRANYYVNIAGRTLKLYQRDDRGLFYLQYKLSGLWPLDLGYFSHLAFSLRTIDGQPYLVSQNSLGIHKLVGPRITPREIPHAWRQRVGKYRVVTPLAAAKISSGGLKLDDGFLIAYASIKNAPSLSVILLPVNDNDAIVAGLESGFGETVSVLKQGDAELLQFSDIVFRRP